MTAPHQIEREREAGEPSAYNHHRIAERTRDRIEVNGSYERITG